jgi:chemotaxis protein MotA
MFFALGAIIVFGCVAGGYLASGGHLGVLWQPFEFLIIFGAMIGAFVIANPKHVLVATLKSLPHIFKGAKASKAQYMELLCLLFAIFKLAKTKGDLALETHVDNPGQSSLFSQYPLVAKQHGAMEFLCDNLRLIVLGANNPHELEAAMDAELFAHGSDNHGLVNALSNAADGLPALGIVAAVLGVIHTMGSITEPPEVLGHLIGGALVGTFSGVLAAYGLVTPMGKALEAALAAEERFLECIKAGLVAHTHGYAPQISVEHARKTVIGAARPSFGELDERLQSVQVP